MRKKILIVFAVVLLLPAMAVAQGRGDNAQAQNGSDTSVSSDADDSVVGEDLDLEEDEAGITSSGEATQKGNQGSADHLRTEIKTRVMESNPGTGEMTMEEVHTAAREEARSVAKEVIQTVKPNYSPKALNGNSIFSSIEDASEEIVVTAAVLEDREQGNKLVSEVRGYIENAEDAAEALDKASERSGFSKFFVGPNFGQLQSVKKNLERMQMQIQQMTKIQTQVKNESEKEILQTQIQTLEEQATALEAELNNADDGFSLLGWLFRIVDGY